MSIYVDPMAAVLMNVNWRWPEACHLYADTVAELHAFAVRIGLNRSWFQDRADFPHYDLTGRIREVAVRGGAIERTSRQTVTWFQANRARRRGRRPDPATVTLLTMAAALIQSPDNGGDVCES